MAKVYSEMIAVPMMTRQMTGSDLRYTSRVDIAGSPPPECCFTDQCITNDDCMASQVCIPSGAFNFKHISLRDRKLSPRHRLRDLAGGTCRPSSRAVDIVIRVSL